MSFSYISDTFGRHRRKEVTRFTAVEKRAIELIKGYVANNFNDREVFVRDFKEVGLVFRALMEVDGQTVVDEDVPLWLNQFLGFSFTDFYTCCEMQKNIDKQLKTAISEQNNKTREMQESLMRERKKFETFERLMQTRLMYERMRQERINELIREHERQTHMLEEHFRKFYALCEFIPKKLNRAERLRRIRNSLKKICKTFARTLKEKNDEEKLYRELNQKKYKKGKFETKELGEGMEVVSQIIGGWGKPRYLLNRDTKTAFEWMDLEETLVTVTEDDIDWDSLKGLDKKLTDRAHWLWVHYPSFVTRFKFGVSLVEWQLNPDGRYYRDEDGYGMTDDEEVNIYGYIDKEGHVLVKFRTIKDYDELKTMLVEAVKNNLKRNGL